jgi:hypothetical protein
MPICEIDPWRIQFFTHARCPAGVRIPTEDSDAWAWNSRYRWVYDRIAIARSQGLAAGPNGTLPPRFPVFSKPIVNLKGMGLGTRIVLSLEDYERHGKAGHMWMTLLTGRHVSSDAAVVGGNARWWRHVTGRPAGGGTFDYWTVHADADPALEASLGGWIATHLHDYTGMVNLETIDGSIIEIHLRMSDQWPDLYGHGWVEALVGLYRRPQSSRRLQRRPVWSGGQAMATSATGEGSGNSCYAQHLQRTDHVSRGPRSRIACDAAGWFPARDYQVLESRGRACRSQSAPCVLSDSASSPQ